MVLRVKSHAMAVTLVLLASVFISLHSAGAAEEVLWDDWWLIKINGTEAGWRHTKAIKHVENGRVAYRTEEFFRLKIAALGQMRLVSTETTTLEDGEGHVFEDHEREHGTEGEKSRYLEVRGESAELTVTVAGKSYSSTFPWDQEVIGPVAKWRLKKEIGTESGKRYSYKTFSFDALKVKTITVRIWGKEDTALLDGEKAALHRVTYSSGNEQREGESVVWRDDEGRSMKSLDEGSNFMWEEYRTSEERAKKAKWAELEENSIVVARSNVNLPPPSRLDSILYRIEAKSPDSGILEDLGDIRQKLVERENGAATVLIKTMVPNTMQKRPMVDPLHDLAEYLEPNPLIQSDHAELRAKALEVAGDEIDAWKAACLLERFVCDYVRDKIDNLVWLSAVEVFEGRRGDCSEHGVFLTALCRAAGIPARVATGLAYWGGVFRGHMWTEVWIDGAWYPLDGILGMGRVGPGHIRILSSSLKDGQFDYHLYDSMTDDLEITILEFRQDGEMIKVGRNFKDYLIDGNRYSNILYGIAITKPRDYRFKNYQRDFSSMNFTLVEMFGDTSAALEAMPVNFTFKMEDFKDYLKPKDHAIVSELPRNVLGRTGRIYMIRHNNDVYRLLAFIDRETCYVLKMKIEDEERDIMSFETIVRSVSFE